MHGDVVEVVERYTYLDSILHRNGRVGANVKSRIAKASRVFGLLLNTGPIFNNLTFSWELKLRVCHCQPDFTVWGGELDPNGCPSQSPAQ